MRAVINNLGWCSDWNGYEVGFPEINVVGLYHSSNLGADLLIDTETGEVLRIMMDEDGEEV